MEANPASAAPRAIGPGDEQGAPGGPGESGDAGLSFCRFHECVCVCAYTLVKLMLPAPLTSFPPAARCLATTAWWKVHSGTTATRRAASGQRSPGLCVWPGATQTAALVCAALPPRPSFQADPEVRAGGAPVSTSYAPTQRHRAQAPSVVNSTR